MLLLAVLAGCQCNDPDTYTTIDADTNSDEESPYPKPYTTPEQSGTTADTSVPSECAGLRACWRFELPASKKGVPDLSGNEQPLTLAGAASIVGPGSMLPAGVPNTGMLTLGGEDDHAYVDVDGTRLDEYTDGFSVEVLVRASEKTLAADPQGNRRRTVVWLDDDLVSLRMVGDDKGDVQLEGRINHRGGGADTCAVEALGTLPSTLSAGACLSMTYTPEGLLRLFVNGVEVGSGSTAKACAAPAQIGPAAKGARFQVGADGTVTDAKADQSWRGDIDEVRIAREVVSAKDLSCALWASR